MSIWSDVAGTRGPVIVLIHGSMDRSAGLLRLSRRLTGEHRVVRFDRRGYGRSTDAGGPFTVERNKDDLRNVIVEATNGAGADLVFGHSFGGNVALALASEAPELARRVAVYESPQPWRHPRPAPADDELMDPADDAEQFMRVLIGDQMWERLPASARIARRAEGVVLREELADLGQAAAWDPSAVRVPVLAIAGEHAAERHRKAMQAVAEEISGALFAEIAGAGHLGPNTHADEVAALLCGLLDRSVQLAD